MKTMPWEGRVPGRRKQETMNVIAMTKPQKLALSGAGVLLSPAVIFGFCFLVHAAAFRGECGPYAPDISAHACGLGTYLINFFSPFAVAGMVMLSPVIMGSVALLLAFGWCLIALVHKKLGR